MIYWRTERPKGSIIVAKLTESFTHSDHSYEILFWNVLGYYYDYAGEDGRRYYVRKIEGLSI